MKKNVSVLILLLIVSSCGMHGGLQRNRPASGLEWNSKSSNSQDENIAENIDLVKENKVDVNAKKINSNSKVISNNVNYNDLASNSKNLSDLESVLFSNSITSLSKVDKSNYTNLTSKKQINKEEKKSQKRKETKTPVKSDIPIEVLYICCILWPTITVAYVTDLDWEKILLNLVLCFLLWLPGIIHAFKVVKNNR